PPSVRGCCGSRAATPAARSPARQTLSQIGSNASGKRTGGWQRTSRNTKRDTQMISHTSRASSTPWTRAVRKESSGDMPSGRLPPFYWVRLDESWTVAEHDPTAARPWYVIGADEAVSDSAFAEIGPRVALPEETKRFRNAEEERDDLARRLAY